MWETMFVANRRRVSISSSVGVGPSISQRPKGFRGLGLSRCLVLLLSCVRNPVCSRKVRTSSGDVARRISLREGVFLLSLYCLFWYVCIME